MTQENVRVILVAKFMGLGSIIHSTPMLRGLKKQYPNAKLLFLTRKANSDLFSHTPDVDEVLYIDDSSLYRFVISNIKTIYIMAGRRLDLYFDLELFSTYGALMSLFSLARNRLGFFCSMETDYKAKIYTHLMYFNFQVPIRVCYLQLARMAHVSPEAPSSLVPLRLGEEAVRTCREKLTALLGDDRGKGVLCFNVNASDLCLERRWPGERFAAVARYFAGKGYTVLLAGSPAERPYVQTVLDLVGGVGQPAGRVMNVAGDFNFSEFLAFLSTCDAVLTNDSGIMNFSYGLGVSTLSLFGPCASIRYHVEAENTRFIGKQVYCRPCLHHLEQAPCRGENVCMSSIGTDEVIETLEELIQARPEPITRKTPLLLVANQNPLGTLRTRKTPEKKVRKRATHGTSL